MQAIYLLALKPAAETQADPHSYGFREGRCAHDAIEQLAICMATSNAGQWVLEGDIKACFDTISHDWLRDNIPMDKFILSQWLKAGYMEKAKIFPTKEGTPQGGLASPTLANMALDGLQSVIQKAAKKASVRANLIRYADDFIVNCNSRTALQSCIKPAIEDFLKPRGLMLSEEKTMITHINEGFDFLGKQVRKYSGKLVIKPAKDSIMAIVSKVKEVIKRQGRHLTVYQLKRLINPKLRGWAYYHRFCSSYRTFATVDHQIFQLLYRWARRKHSTKSKRWVYKRYFDPHHGFFNQWDKSSPNPKLFRLTSLGIRRYIKVKMHANPFDSVWDSYFLRRQHGHIFR